MMIKRKMSLLALMAGVVFMMSCNMPAGDSTEFKTTESGLKYMMVINNQDQPLPQTGEILSLAMTYGTEDTLLFNTNQIPDGAMKLKMQEPAYPGDFYEMMNMMHLGDSVVFIQAADSFFTKTAGAPMVPPEMKGKQLTFNVKLTKIQTEQELQDEMMAEMEKQRLEEADKIEAYITENGIDVEPTESGLYVIVTEKGNGPVPKQGDKVKAHYTGMLLDGTKFDSSLDRGEPFEFTIGGRVIGGWNEGFALLNVGSKATLIIPSSLGYGERGAGHDIPPFAPLRFEVELLGIVK